MASSFCIAEKTTAAYRVFALLRWALVIVFLWFGGMKFTGYEANGIAPFIANSPIMSWLDALFGIQGADWIGDPRFAQQRLGFGEPRGLERPVPRPEFIVPDLENFVKRAQ